MIGKFFPELTHSSIASFWSVPQAPVVVSEMPSFALALGEALQAGKAERQALLPLFPPQQPTDSHPTASDSRFRSFLVGDKMLVDWKTHSLTSARV